MEFDAIILAGEKEASIPVKGQNKAFIKFRDKYIVERVIEAVDACDTLRSITVVGPRRKLEDHLQGVSTRKPFKIIEQGDNVFENVYLSGLSTFPEWEPGKPAAEIREKGDPEKIIVGFTSDMPMLDPREIDAFARTMPRERADMIYGVTDHKLLEPFEPAGSDPGIKFIHISTKQIILRHSNIFAYRPLKFAEMLEVYIPLIYKLRYQRHPFNRLVALKEIFAFHMPFRFLWLFAKVQAASYMHNNGHYKMREILRKYVDVPTSEAVVSQDVFKSVFAIHETISVGPTLDIDDEESLNAFLVMYDRWREIQDAQIRAALAK